MKLYKVHVLNYQPVSSIQVDFSYLESGIYQLPENISDTDWIPIIAKNEQDSLIVAMQVLEGISM